MKRFVSINGNNKELDSLNMYTNRAFKFGDGVFESIRIINGRVVNLEHHINRLISGAKITRKLIANRYPLDSQSKKAEGKNIL